jgi:hypothetical protein
MNNLLILLLKNTLFRRQNQFLESFDAEILRSLCKNRNEHIYQKVYNSSTNFIKYFFNSSKLGELLKVKPIRHNEFLEIKCQFPDATEVNKLSKIYKASYGIAFETFQKLYLDRGYNFPKNVVFFDTGGNKILECNRFASIGNVSRNVTNVNLIAGASETFQLIGKPIGDSINDEGNFLKLGFPFHEVNETISNAIEGANFDIIVDSIHKLKKRLNAENIEIDVIAGTFGWHNLIYNQTSEKHWGDCLSKIRANCKKLCVFEIYSPVLHLSNREIIEFSSAPGKVFWGSIKLSDDSINELRSAMLRYNNFINNYSMKNENVLVVPINNLCPVENLEFAIKHFIDVNHIVNDESFRTKLCDSIKTYCGKNYKFFVPDFKKIPEYIYPLF